MPARTGAHAVCRPRSPGGRSPRSVRRRPVNLPVPPISRRQQLVFTCGRGCGGCGVEAMQALTLMIVYVLTTAMVQFIGFLISRVVDYEYPTLGLMTFLVLFLGAFGVAWPIAVRLAEWLIRRAGHVVETEQ